MILDEILARRRELLAQEKATLTLAEVKAQAQAQPRPLDLAAALRGPGVKLIAEVKRASPSRGLLRAGFDPVALAQTYAQNGAAAISVLTEPAFFLGAPEHLQAIRRALGEGTRPPLLRKDFIFDPYQVHQSRALGADALLLIAAILPQEELSRLLGLSRRLGLRCLVEVHQEAEVEKALACGAQIIGINNRDLATFQVDLATTARLRPLIPARCLVVSESGIQGRHHMEQLERWGVNAALVGEALVTAPDVAAKVRELA